MPTRLALAAALVLAITVPLVAGRIHRNRWHRIDHSEPEPNVHVFRPQFRIVTAPGA